MEMNNLKEMKQYTKNTHLYKSNQSHTHSYGYIIKKSIPNKPTFTMIMKNRRDEHDANEEHIICITNDQIIHDDIPIFTPVKFITSRTIRQFNSEYGDATEIEVV